ncbi:MAG TPA: tRNA (adenosine(37)-N6)-threonylcarbamoyltransferase complex ATPase subunit type 1 TsaE [Gammaproteobacteria bacterium]|nr:tRNA (adenosine(37)-N6)-threonylcarbamoyltransferase complex ATPase subunit type 1 TsaE [Gammaproteobacteria bacterium]
MPGMNIEVADAAAMAALGGRLAGVLGSGIVYLEGDLGAGKTTLARGILHGLGHAGSVRSPTYTLVEPYPVTQGMVYHLDLYRLADPEELEWLGLRDMLDPGTLLLIEWPERGIGSLPAPDLIVRIAPANGGRSVDLVSASARGRHMLDLFESL